MAPTTQPHCWGETFGYDVWGNLLSIGGIQPQYNGCTQENLSVLATTKNQISTSCYDSAGNLVLNTACPQPPGTPFTPTYNYDAENRMIQSAVGGATVTYAYDGDGKRVKKDQTNGSTYDKLYWYGLGADPLEESDLAGTATADYIFFNGKRIARRDLPGGTVHYYFANHLGSANVVTNAAGTTIEDESDYYPFGGERAITSADPNQYKFTGKERDTESSLDFFGARYYSSQYSRFMTPDWAASPTAVPYADFGDPESLNLYCYVRNNPLNRIDLDGHDGFLDSIKRAAQATYRAVRQAGEVVKDSVVTSANAYGSALNTTGQVLSENPGFSIQNISGKDLNNIGKNITLMVATGLVAEAVAADIAAEASATRAGRPTTVVPKEGIYEGPDATAPGKTYVGQSGNMPQRLTQHEAAGKFPEGTPVRTKEVLGGKTAREVAEQNRINELGGVKSTPGSRTSNTRNPIGAARKELMNKKEPN